MITKLNINKFGLFHDYKWDNEFGNRELFKKINIIYGRNYSGKTTLARVFKCVEKGELHQDYQDADFQIYLDNGTIISKENLATFKDSIQVRVYNTDFIKENLSWLHNADGTIKPFTILGTKNVELDKKIKQIDSKLGSEEQKSGLIYELLQKTESFNSKKKNYTSSHSDLEDKLRDKARDIKNKSAIFNFPTYQINTIKTDIPEASKLGILTPDAESDRHKLLKEDAKAEIQLIPTIEPSFAKILSNTTALLQKKIKPSQPIIDLVNDSLLQEWVRQGIDRHKGTRDKCGFCGNPLPLNIWEKLDAHFSKESEELRAELTNQINEIESEKHRIKSLINLVKVQFYSGYHPSFEHLNETWLLVVDSYCKELDKLIDVIRLRELDIFQERYIPTIEDFTNSILHEIEEYNDLIKINNLKTGSLSTDQNIARKELRLSEVAKCIKSIDYFSKIASIAKLEEEVKALEVDKNAKQNEITILLEEKRSLEAQAKDESKGAELVNQHLT